MIQRDKRTWPRCLVWHGWLPALDGSGGWAGRPPTLAANILESRLGGYVCEDFNGWSISEDWVQSVGTGSLSATPDVWTDGSLVRDEVSGVLAVLEFFLLPPGLVGFGGLGGIWSCSHRTAILVLRGFGCFFLSLSPCTLCKGLNIGCQCCPASC